MGICGRLGNHVWEPTPTYLDQIQEQLTAKHISSESRSLGAKNCGCSARAAASSADGAAYQACS